MIRRLAAATTGAVLLCTAFAGTASAQDPTGPAGLLLRRAVEAAPADTPAIADGYYKKAYSPDVFRVDTVDGVQFSEPVSYRRWVLDGRPAPLPLPVRYVVTSFTGTAVYGLSSLPQPEEEGGENLMIDQLTYDEYVAAGSPVPELSNEPPVASIFRYATSSEVFGSPLVYAGEEELSVVKLTYAQWTALGSPEPEVVDGGYLKLSWSPEIIFRYPGDPEEGHEGYEYAVDARSWQYAGFPTPVEAARFDGDQFFFATAGSPVVTYAGPTHYGTVSYGQWVAAGSPTPAAGPR